LSNLVLSFNSKKIKKIKNPKYVLGGKGANLSEMGELGLPVPPGFIISTKACELFYKNKKKLPKQVLKDIQLELKVIEKLTNKKFGCLKNPLLVSVRSGARVSMPGMMEDLLKTVTEDLFRCMPTWFSISRDIYSKE
jgi:pyruvate,orthophosphate dikinase